MDFVGHRRKILNEIMIDGSKKGTSFLCQNVVKKHREKNCLQGSVVRKSGALKKSLQRKIFIPSLSVDICP